MEIMKVIDHDSITSYCNSFIDVGQVVVWDIASTNSEKTIHTPKMHKSAGDSNQQMKFYTEFSNITIHAALGTQSGIPLMKRTVQTGSKLLPC